MKCKSDTTIIRRDGLVAQTAAPFYERNKKMLVETDFTTKRHTLVFEKRRIDLDKPESHELDLWFEQKLTDNLVSNKNET